MFNRIFTNLLLFVFAFAAISSCGPEEDEDLRAAVELFLINHISEWRAVSCVSDRIEGETFMHCAHPGVLDQGPMFKLDEEAHVAYLLNGEAIKYARRGTLELIDGRPAKFERWTGGGYDLAEIRGDLRSFW